MFMRNKKYTIDKRNDGFYFPRLDRWIMDSFNLKLVEAMIYNLILIKGYLIWDYGYVGKVLACNPKTVGRTIQKLKEMQIIEVRTKLYDGNKKRNVLVGLYTVEGLRSDWEIENMFRLGFEKLDSFYNN